MLNARSIILLAGLFLIATYPTHGQGLLRKMKQTIKKEGNKALDDVLGTDTNEPVSNPGNSGTNTSSGTSEKKMMKPPDVLENIGYAENALSKPDYNDAIFSVQQALVGVEWHLGKAVLESLPTSINGLNYVKEKDVVQSTGIGFAGLIISRFYGDSKQSVEFSLANNSALLSAYSMIINNPAYWSSTQDDTKAVRINDEKAVMEYKDNGDYAIGIPFGQSSISLMNFQNFEDEELVIQSAENFDLSAAKKILGEQ